MFRITRIATPDATILKVQGKLIAAGIAEFEATVNDAAQQGAPIRLDLSGLRFTDSAGLDSLTSLLRNGVTLSGCSNFIADLLHTVKQ